MKSEDDLLYKRAARQQDYEHFRSHAKAPPFRRTAAAVIDLAIVGAPALYGFKHTGDYLFALFMVAYFLLRDWLFGGRSFGKWLTGLLVVHHLTFRPCTLRQSVIRNSLYAVFGPIFAFAGLATMGLGGLLLSCGVFLIALTRVNLLFSIGYDDRDGRTIPDSWAETHVLTPGEILAMTRMKAALDELC